MRSILFVLTKYLISTIMAISMPPTLVMASYVTAPKNFSIKNAKDFIVKVVSQGSPGSGVVVILPDGKLAVITAGHVLSGTTNAETIGIIFTGGFTYEANKSDVKMMTEADLAILIVNENSLGKYANTVTPVVLSKNINTGEEIMVAGFPIDNSKTVSSDLRVTTGKIQTIASSSQSDGYELGYSSKTYIGMSGGGVFNTRGELIAIHGRGEAIPSSDVNKTGTNFGVPISKAINWYRSTMVRRENAADPILGSRYILAENFKDALPIWEALMVEYPDSSVAHHNVKCLRSKVQNSASQTGFVSLNLYNRQNPIMAFPELIETATGMNPGSADEVSMYLSDPLVNKYSSQQVKRLLKEDHYRRTVSMSIGSLLLMGLGVVDGSCECLVLSSKTTRNTATPFQPSNIIRRDKSFWP